jgi:RimJ/RimL family protein N-acetyltransferase
MILPSKIEVQIIDAVGKPNLLGNILFGLKIFTSDSSWHNYSFFKSDIAGHIVLTKQDIIANTELRWEKNFQSVIPTKFELYVWQGEQAAKVIEATKKSLELCKDEKFVEQDLKRHGVVGENITHALSVITRKAVEDEKFYLYIRDAINHLVKVDTGKIEGIWFDDSPKLYQFVIQMQPTFKLRPWAITDLGSLVKHANNWNVAKNMTDKFPFPYLERDGRNFIAFATQGEPIHIFAIEVGGQAVGGIGIHLQDDIHRRNAELGYWLAEPFWGQGIISAAIKQAVAFAFQTYDIDRPCCYWRGCCKASAWAASTAPRPPTSPKWPGRGIGASGRAFST